MSRRALIIVWLVLILIAIIGLTACATPEASVTVRSNIGSDQQPYVHCDAVVPNPDYVPPSTSVRP